VRAICWVVAILFLMASALYALAGIAGGWDGWLIVAALACPVAALVAIRSARARTPIAPTSLGEVP